MRTTFDPAKYVTETFGHLAGKTIESVRALTPNECKNLAWEHDTRGGCPPMVIFFTDGTDLIPMADPEGNGPGFLSLSENDF